MPARTIRIAAAVIRDEGGRLLLVRKRGTSDPAAAFHLGSFSAPAANEPETQVEAELFELSIIGEPVLAAEIEEMIWLNPEAAAGIELAPLTATFVLPRYGRQP
ncbi:hypothetical protein EOD04_33700 [Mesorhizobium sp. M2C.T.Ca.TU.009.01.2.1]|nr:hypothetical protein EOD07_23675 [Mesorhizobium sp. M2C.T.Ca.TU.002.02.1.1]RUU53735.1 hypothetical protein EOD04_33700 [Mesorhizobium sp. M2C.T.Ca.TU.009.01.2.1]